MTSTPFRRSALIVSGVLVAGSWLWAGSPRRQGQATASAGTAGRFPAAQAVGLVNTILRPKGEPIEPAAAPAQRSDLPSSVVAGLPASEPPTVSALTITPVFDSSITSDPNSAAIVGAINAAIADIQSRYMDPIGATINFATMGSGLGMSSTYYCNYSYATYLAALKADAKTASDAVANSLLPSSSTNPVNGASSINVKTANLRAVGITCSLPPGAPDGTVSLNTSITIPGSPGSTLQYSLQSVAEHEIDEVLGLSSSLPTVLGGTIFPQDLFRYNSAGARTFTTLGSVIAFFSLDGTTHVAQFDNQNDGGDFGDWQSNPLPMGVAPKVQDAFATAGSNPPYGVAEITALDVIGYDAGAGAGPVITSQPSNQTIPYNTGATLSVTASGSSLSYQWYRGSSGDTSAPVGTNPSNYTTPALISNTKYWVRVSNASGHADSTTASVSVTFTDNSLGAGVIRIRLVHLTQLRARIDALRQRFGGRPPYSYTHAALTADASGIAAVDLLEMRTALAQAYSDSGIGTVPTYSTMPGAGSAILVADVAELRNWVTTLEDH